MPIHSFTNPPAASIAYRAPLLTRNPLIWIARSRFPEAITLTRSTILETNRAFLRALRSIVASDKPFSSCSLSSALNLDFREVNPTLGNLRCNGIRHIVTIKV